MRQIADIKSELETIASDDTERLRAFILDNREDGRKGVVSLLKRADKLIEAYEAELARTEVMYAFEDKYKAEGFSCICGIDEVGRGPFAGPVVTAAVILPSDRRIPWLNDSKQVKKEKREELYDILVKEAVAYGIGIVGEETIDEINIANATKKAMCMAVENLSVKPDFLLVDSVNLDMLGLPLEHPDKGDTLSASIAAASIVAKVTRDRMMEEYASVYPGYGFERNAGYGTPEHIAAIKQLGPCPLHRRTFISKYI
ncbi:MAG: ribonuclease HII [Lachnospiraceae bacterium]|nr:ribonuclease HII [Lachnospiraceae bacterium]